MPSHALQQETLLLSEDDHHVLSSLLEARTGISIGSGKRDLVQARLRQRIGKLGLGSFREYARQLRGLPADDPEWQEFVNLLTTNKTDFFREAEHFSYLVEKFLPVWLRRREKVLRVWCCAASTGEEPYTLSMCLGSRVEAHGRRVEILATDIDTEVLERAASGVYRGTAAEQIPPDFRAGSFAQGSDEIAKWFRVSRAVRDRVSFAPHNLMSDRVPRSDFDLVFCRNVMIYFKPDTIAAVAARLHRAARPGALLFTGHSESLQNVKQPWRYVSPSLYRKGEDK